MELNHFRSEAATDIQAEDGTIEIDGAREVVHIDVHKHLHGGHLGCALIDHDHIEQSGRNPWHILKYFENIFRTVELVFPGTSLS